MPELKAPFPYFGGKSRVADIVWDRFGNVPNYCEPFFGSGAVLLARPHAPGIETVNDIDCMLANFWRALKQDPDEVTYYADWPVNEADQHARHLWLCSRAEFRERMKVDPDFYDPKIAGYWVWGQCSWIGSGWCSAKLENLETEDWGPARQLPHLGGVGGGMGIHSKMPHLGNGGTGIHRKRPHLSSSHGINRQLPHLADAGQGIHRKLPPSERRGNRSSSEAGDAGRGVNRQLPHLGDAGRGMNRQLPHLGNGGTGVHRHSCRTATHEKLLAYMRELSERLRSVRVCCGNWDRILGPSPTFKHGITGVFLDPPYADEADRQDDLYSHDSGTVAHAVREWAIANGGNPLLRIALCGYEGEHALPPDWQCVAWKTRGGYGSQGEGRGRENAGRERIWFSPACLEPPTLFPFDGTGWMAEELEMIDELSLEESEARTL
jgi:D12 class N6 adenine-specific DNA methyltransferase